MGTASGGEGTAVALPPPMMPSGGVFVTVRQGEMWCQRCGDFGVVHSNKTGAESCVRCGSRRLVRAEEVLRVGEYRVAG
jgi:DNA-directed RNA polymerase subunit RPC12/RpoP